MNAECEAGYPQNDGPCVWCGATAQQACGRRHADPRDQIIKDLRAEVEGLQWQDATNRPPIYEEVLVLCQHGHVGLGSWMGHSDWSHTRYPVLGQCKPTHWMPLPKLPEALRGEARRGEGE